MKTLQQLDVGSVANGLPPSELARRVDGALALTRDFALSGQQPDGTWSGPVESDPRPTAFYLYAIRNLGRGPDGETREMESYLASTQLNCGAWSAWPNGPPDVDVTAVCEIALQIADTERGRAARSRAQDWLLRQPPPGTDSFWRGFLALNGDLDWVDLPYLSPRIVSNPPWLRPNIYDFSFLRIAIVSASLLQHHLPRHKAGTCRGAEAPESAAFTHWKERWIEECRQPIQGLLSRACGTIRAVDHAFSVDKHARIALDWLLNHQETDGSFFSSVHITAIAIVTLNQLDSVAYRQQVEAGLSAMRRWQVTDARGRRQQFTDSTTWDTLLFLDLLGRLGVPSDHPKVQAARDYALASQSAHLGDWSRRVRRPSPGGWGFQRVGQWYPDCDDTVMAVTALLDIGEAACVSAAKKAVEWLLQMQSSDGGWASWDRNDRPWIRIPNGGPWFARDLGSVEITARVIIVLSGVCNGRYPALDDLAVPARGALRRGVRWLRRKHKDGVWFGRWFTHYLYGTCHALEALSELGEEANEPVVRAALAWLTDVANEDGGFGESAHSAGQNRFVPAPSTPFHTACGLLALVHASASNHPVADRAASWLLDHQNDDGSWTNSDYFAAGVPGLWYANFGLTPTYFGAKALILFRRERFKGM